MPDESVALRETSISTTHQHELADTERSVPGQSDSNVKQRESHWQRARVLLGASILQLPIWGMPDMRR